MFFRFIGILKGFLEVEWDIMAKEDEHVSQTGKSWIHRLETRIIYKNSSLFISLSLSRLSLSLVDDLSGQST